MEEVAMSFNVIPTMMADAQISAAFKDRKITKDEAKQIFQAANPDHELQKGDDQEALAHNVAKRLSQASGGKLTEKDAMAVSKAIVKELYESVVHSSGNGKFDTVKSPFKPSAFDFALSPEAYKQQNSDELTETAVQVTVKGRDKPATVADLTKNAAHRKDFLERCVQLDGNTKSVLDRSSCSVISTLGGYILADPAAFQKLGAALQKGDVPQLPGFAKLRSQDKNLQAAVDRIAKGAFSPKDVVTVGLALARTNGVHGPDYATGEGGGGTMYQSAVLVERLTAIGAPPPDGLTLGSVAGMHQVAKYKGEYFDSSATPHMRDGHKPYYATVSKDLGYAAGGVDKIEMVFSQKGTKAEIDWGSGPPEGMTLVGGQYQMTSGDADGAAAKRLSDGRAKAHL
jgi:hypothetical protein